MKHACQVNLCFNPKASRLKLFTRILWWFVMMWIFIVWGFAANFLGIFQWFIILFLGKRSEGIFAFRQKFFRYMVRTQAWLWLLTDERPKLSDEYEPYCKCKNCDSNNTK